MQCRRPPSLGWGDPLEEGMATHSNILSRESHEQKSLAGYSPWDSKELNTTEQLSPHTHTHTHTCTRAHMHTRTRTHACMHARAHTHTHTHPWENQSSFPSCSSYLYGKGCDCLQLQWSGTKFLPRERGRLSGQRGPQLCLSGLNLF